MSSTETETPEHYWQPGTGGHIAVGIDQSDSSRAALAWAADEARTRDVPLHVIFAWSGIGVDIARASGWVQGSRHGPGETSRRRGHP